jgi:hypothetical protein
VRGRAALLIQVNAAVVLGREEGGVLRDIYVLRNTVRET